MYWGMQASENLVWFESSQSEYKEFIMEENKILPQEEATVQVVDIQFRPGQKIYYFDPNGLACKAGDHVIIDTARGPEFGICAAGNHTIPTREVVAPLRPVLRLATAQDEKTLADNRAKEKQAYDTCIKKIAHHGLDMQLVSAECAFDGSKILFFFTADERVDFRELVKDLAVQFHTRIELRQIGVRDKAKMVGGLGICGRPFCCASFLEDFQPVSIKMAKTQNLSLNPAKISGTCGRLMCCLKYEQDAYEDLIRNSPKLESFVDTPDGRGTVTELDLLRQRVKVRMEDRPETVGVFSNAEIYVLRNGKAKKTDPPIPADLAPISGRGKRVPNPADRLDGPVLETIRFRYSTESVVDEPTPAAETPEVPEAQEPQAPGKSRNRRNRRNRGHKNEEKQAAEKPQTEKKKEKPHKQAEKPQEKKKEQPAEAAEKEPRKPRRHHNRRHRKPSNSAPKPE